MAVLREGNWLGNQRVDIPHLRSIESAVRSDFDLFAGAMLAGKAALITSGFYVLSTGITVATSLKIRTADSSLIHFLASESGSIFHVPSDRADEQLNSVNPRLIGGFTNGTTNYVGLDFVRQADDSTVDLVQFIDSDSELETPIQTPLARTLDYRIHISTLDFDNNPGVCPVAKVTIDDFGNITILQDARQIAFRLGSGGTVPNSQSSFSWPAGRKESDSADEFAGGDKAVNNFKDWMDAVMSRLWEVGGGEYWYSPTTYANEKLARSGAPFVSNGEYFEWDGTNLHWQGLVWIFANSTGVTNTIADITIDTPGLTDLEDGECIYVDVDRTQDIAVSAAKGSLALLGSPTVPGSRYVIAWRNDSEIYTRDQSYAVNSSFILATVAAAGTVTLSSTNSGSTFPAAVATVDDVNFVAYAAGLTRTGADFIGGAGDIQIGGFGANDENVLIETENSDDEVRVQSNNNWLSNAVAALSVNQQAAFGGPGVNTNQILRLAAYDGDDAQFEDVFLFETSGAQIWRLADGTPATPVNTSPSPMVAKEYYRTNGAASPATRTQKVVMWHDGTITVLAESPPY